MTHAWSTYGVLGFRSWFPALLRFGFGFGVWGRETCGITGAKESAMCGLYGRRCMSNTHQKAQQKHQKKKKKQKKNEER